jgi:hypothetical protein
MSIMSDPGAIDLRWLAYPNAQEEQGKFSPVSMRSNVAAGRESADDVSPKSGVTTSLACPLVQISQNVCQTPPLFFRPQDKRRSGECLLDRSSFPLTVSRL